MTMSNLEREGFILLMLLHHSLSPREVKTRTQERNLEAGTVREERCLMACSCDLLSLLLLYFRTMCLARGSIDHHGLGPPTLIIRQEDAL